MTGEHHRGSREEEDQMREEIEEAEPAVDEMERRSEQLEEQIEQTERDWESKRHDQSVPGAQEPLEETETERQDLGEKPAGDER